MLVFLMTKNFSRYNIKMWHMVYVVGLLKIIHLSGKIL